MNPRWRLVLAAAAFIGWLSYLGYAALRKSREPAISRAQAAAAKFALVAELKDGTDQKPDMHVVVKETLTPGNGPAADAEIDVENLPGAAGYSGAGRYLLFLTAPPYTLVGQQRSPGNDLTGVGPPLIYRWSEDMRKQFELLPKK